MALNFPLNPSDGEPYVDPTSGLKYIFNRSIGGWETAIQPPVIITTDGNAPDITIDGFLWWDGQTRTLYILRGGSWTPVTSSGGGGGGGASVTVGENPPLNPVQGDLWWDSVGGNLYVYYVDITSNQWVIASPNVGGESKANIFTGPSAPADPIEGELWYNTLDNTIYVYNLGAWRPSSSAVAGVQSVTGTSPIITQGDEDVVVSISPANTINQGTVRFATQSEVSSLANVEAAVTPGRLAAGIEPYLPEATTTQKGVVELATGDEVVSGTDSTKAVTPATLSLATSAAGNPIGTIIAFAGTNAPTGYLKCNGDVINDVPAQTIQGITADFRNLRTVLGNTFNPSGGADVVLPDLRGEFLRGWSDDKSGVDAGRALGSSQGQDVQTHAHTGPAGPADVETTGDVYGGGNRTGETGIYSTNSAGGSETRPRNIAILYCIKF